MRAPVALTLVLLWFSLASRAAEVPVAEPTFAPADTRSYTRSDPQVIAGDGFLVVWQDNLFGVYPGPILARAYDEDGTPRRPVASVVGNSFTPRVVWTGSEYLIVYATPISRFGSPVPIPAIVAALIRPDGTVIDGSQVTLAESQSQSSVGSLAWNGKEALAYFFINGSPRLLHLDRAGRVLYDESPGVLSRPAMIVAAPTGSQYFLTREEGDVAAVAPDGAVAIIDHTGVGVVATLLDSARAQRRSFVVADAGLTIRSVAWDGRSWIAAYAQEEKVCTVQFTSSGVIARDCEAKTSPRAPFLAAGRMRTFKAWSRGVEQIETDSGVASMTTAPQVSASATLDEKGDLLVAWIEAGRIRLGGPAPHAAPFIEGPQNVTFARVSGSLLVWIENGLVFVSRAQAAGPPGPPALLLGKSNTPVAVAQNERGWLVAWKEGDEIVSTLVGPNLVANGREHYGAAGVRQFSPQVAVTPEGFIVAWAEDETVDQRRRTRVVAERLDPNGLRSSGGVRLTDFDGDYAQSLRLAIGCGAANCIANWGPVDVLAIGFDARPIAEPQRILSTGSPQTLVVPRADGTFDIYDGAYVTSVRSDGSPIAARPWTNAPISLATVVGNLALVTRAENGSARLFVREINTRLRAARH